MPPVSIPSKITVAGRVHLGKALRLVQGAEAPGAGFSLFESGRPQGIASIEYTAPMHRAGELAVERLAYSLAPAPGELFIEGDGLCSAYGIFGGPGSGKTFLMMHLLGQLLSLNAGDPDRKYGMLILDPKAVLIDDVRKKVAAAGREQDLIVVNIDELTRAGATVNPLSAALDPRDLGKVISLAAQAAGVATSDPYWLLAQENLLSAALHVLSLGNDQVTLRMLIDSLLVVEPGPPPERRILRIARTRKTRLDRLTPGQRQDAAAAIGQVEGFFAQQSDSVATIQQILTTGFGIFQQSRYACLSPRESRARVQRRLNLYDAIMEQGKIVLVSLSPSELAMAKTLCTTMKCLFQRSVLSRSARVQAGGLGNYLRPLLLWCDEYGQIASEVPGQPMGDGDFFALCRQQGCMGLLATQSVNVLEHSSLKEAWKSVFSNFSAKVFMRCNDNETTEEASKLAGEYDAYVTSQGTSRGKDGMSSSQTKDLRERKNLPTEVLTEVLQRGDAAVVGSLTGSVGRSNLRFLHVPAQWKP
jgi:TraM recognition site of TraD and TraG